MAVATSQFERRLSRVDRPFSAAAGWCQAFAVFGLILLVLAVAMHRLGALETQPTFWTLGAVVVVELLALVLGARALYELWSRGHAGGLRATRGMALAAIVLAPLAYHAGLAFALPPLHDISTNLDSPPEFDAARDDRQPGMNAFADPTPLEQEAQLRTYPQISARRYPLGQARVFRAVVTLITERDWTVLTTQTEQGNAPIDEEGSGLVARPMTDPAGRPLRPVAPKQRPILRPARPDPTQDPAGLVEAVQVAPTGRDTDAEEPAEGDERYIEAVATSFIFGFESDIVVRLVEREDGTLVDMRSASRWGPHDLGANARLIRDFMADLDLALQGAGIGG